MEDAELLELGREMLATLREACMSDNETLSRRTGLADAEQAYASLEEFLEPRHTVNPNYRDMHLAAAAFFVIASDTEAYSDMMSKLAWKDRQRDVTTLEGAWRALGFLQAVYDDNDFSIDVRGQTPVVGYQEWFDVHLPTLSPRTMLERLRPYAGQIAAGPGTAPGTR